MLESGPASRRDHRRKRVKQCEQTKQKKKRRRRQRNKFEEGLKSRRTEVLKGEEERKKGEGEQNIKCDLDRHEQCDAGGDYI